MKALKFMIFAGFMLALGATATASELRLRYKEYDAGKAGNKTHATAFATIGTKDNPMIDASLIYDQKSRKLLMGGATAYTPRGNLRAYIGKNDEDMYGAAFNGKGRAFLDAAYNRYGEDHQEDAALGVNKWFTTIKTGFSHTERPAELGHATGIENTGRMSAWYNGPAFQFLPEDRMHIAAACHIGHNERRTAMLGFYPEKFDGSGGMFRLVFESKPGQDTRRIDLLYVPGAVKSRFGLFGDYGDNDLNKSNLIGKPHSTPHTDPTSYFPDEREIDRATRTGAIRAKIDDVRGKTTRNFTGTIHAEPITGHVPVFNEPYASVTVSNTSKPNYILGARVAGFECRFESNPQTTVLWKEFEF